MPESLWTYTYLNFSSLLAFIGSYAYWPVTLNSIYKNHNNPSDKAIP